MVRKAVRILGILGLVLGLSVMGLAQTKTLTILHTNDTHSALLPFTHQPYPTPFTWLWPDHRQGWVDEFRGPGGFNRDYAGIARMSTLIKKIRQAKDNVLAFHTGDAFVGSFMFNKYLGYPELKIMENLYDAMAAGNHEFDLGMDALAGILSGVIPSGPAVTLPLLNANYNLTGHALAGLLQRSIVRTVDGVKIGIFGIGNEDPTNFSAEVIARFSNDPYAVAGMQAYELRAQGCQVVICLSHLGTLLDTEGLSQVPGVDIIVGGHSHDLFRRAILRNGKIIIQAGSHGRYLGELQVMVEPGGGVKLLNWRSHEVDKTVKPDPSLKAQLDMLTAGVVQDPRFGPVFTEAVAYAFRNIDQEWPAKGPNRDAPLGILVADAMKSALLASPGLPPVDCVLDPMGYTEFGIPAGKVVGNDILRAVPYGYDPASGLGFKIVIAPLPGEFILGALEYTVTYVEYTDSLSVQPSGLTFAYDSSQPPAASLGDISRLDPMSVKIGDEYVAANLQKIYYVGMTDQVFKFLNSLVGGGLVKIDTGLFEYNAVRDYMRALRFVSYRSEGRVIDTAPGPALALSRR
ncbi:MAG: hypothetical protein A2W20_04815 [Candidatus Aminicenantes bacterium RBG_16_66_30]|nr:MAG: hypothetical protein A2W20_04815 [Candidatus Aminicenantes bacterium RBG_16_66_30]